jgi:hypothetical protein
VTCEASWHPLVLSRPFVVGDTGLDPMTSTV